MSEGGAGRSRPVLAFLVSFLVYLLPLPGPHAVPVLGQVVAGALSGASRGAAQGLALAGVALALQGAAFLVLWWVFGGRWRWLLLVPLAPAAAVAAWMLTLVVIPRFTLIERDPAPERLDWRVECAVPDAAVEAVRGPLRGGMARAGLAWLRTGKDGLGHSLLRVPGCGLSAAGAPPRGATHGLAHAAPTGASLETTWDRDSQSQLWWWRAAPEAEAAPVTCLPERVDSVPILTNDGNHLAWVERPAPPPAVPRIAVARHDGAERREIPLDAVSPASFVLLEVDLDAGVAHLARNERELVAVGLDGGVAASPFAPPEVEPLSTTLRLVEGGWMAWDGYVEEREYRIAWSTPAGRGLHRVPKGRGIQSADVDPSGRFVAISTGPVYSLGGVDDAVVVLSAAGGGEVFRDALPAHARSEVAFVGEGLLAYTSWDGGTRTEVRVVRAP